jgi:chromosome segregation ATPase
VTVFPDDSPEGWWSIEQVDGETSLRGFVPRSFVKLNTGPFLDVPGDHWAAPALKRLKSSGALTGYEGDRFRGSQAFSRFEMAVLLDRYMDRLKGARERIEDQIAKIPMQTHLGGHDSKTLDEVIQNLERLSREEKQLRGLMENLHGRVEANEQRLDSMHDEVASVVHHDSQQDRRLDELARTASKLTAEVSALRSMGKTYARSSGNGSPDTQLTSSLAVNIVKVKELVTRAESLEAKVSALEARDRLAQLLQREEKVRAEKSPMFAVRDITALSEPGRM